jgi:thiamine pyrophosphokinase
LDQFVCFGTSETKYKGRCTVRRYFDRDFDANYYKEHQHPIEIVHARPKQNRLGKAFDYLYERKIAAVNVVWATGKRTDHTITNLTNIVRYREKLES